MSEKTTRILLYLFLTLFLLPFLCGILFLFSSSVGFTPTWNLSKFDLSFFKILLEPIIYKQFILGFIRTNIIGIIVFGSAFVGGFMVYSQLQSRAIRICMYFLSIPHVALAVGFSYLIMPTGLFFRIIAHISENHNIGEVVLINDHMGIAMSIVVLLKVIPFIIFMMLGSSQDYNLRSQILQSTLLGHSNFHTWTYILFPQLLPKIFMPFMIVLIYAWTPIDISAIIGPRSPSSIGRIIQELLEQGFREPYINAHVLSIILLIASCITMLIWYAVFKYTHKLLRKGYENPNRNTISSRFCYTFSLWNTSIFVAIILLSTTLLLCWCMIIRWDFPQLLPNTVGISHLHIYFSQFFSSLGTTLIVAILSMTMSLIISIYVLEILTKLSWHGQYIVLGIIILPLLVPTIVYISGMHVFFSFLKLNGSLLGLVWSHTLHTLPYMILLLYGTMKSYNHFYVIQGRALGKSYFNTLFKIKLPMIFTPLLYASLISMLVSIAEYVSTQFIGGGVLSTITTLTVALYSGSNRQVMSMAGMMLTLLNLVILLLGLLTKYFQKGNRKVYI